MIERIVLIKLEADSATDRQRQALAAHSEQVLSGLPELRSLSLGLPSDAHALRSWDISVVMQFEDQPAVDRAVEHPRYREWLTGPWAEHVAVVKNWSFSRYESAAAQPDAR